jgi:hypothetical protein
VLPPERLDEAAARLAAARHDAPGAFPGRPAYV